MTEFLDGVKDGVKGEVTDLTTVNFDAMELRKLLGERNAWAGRIKKLEEGKGSVSVEIWKKLRNEYDQKLKARENELITVRERMRKKLEEMVKLKDSIEREFPPLQKRREELTLRFHLGDFNQEFYDYVNAELTFQIDVRQKKVEVLGRNLTFFRETLALEDAPGGSVRVSDKDTPEGEGFGKGGGSGGVTATAWPPPLAETAAGPDADEEPAGVTGAAEELDAPIEDAEEEEPTPAWTVPGREAPGVTPRASLGGAGESEETQDEEEAESIASPDLDEEEPATPVSYVNIPAEEADSLEEEEDAEPEDDEASFGNLNADAGAAASTIEETESISYTEEVSSLEADGVQELEEEIEEDLAVEGVSGAEAGGYLDSVAGSMDTEEQLNALTIDEDVDLSAEAAPAAFSLPGPGRRRDLGGLDPGQEIDLGEAPAHIGPTPAYVSRSAAPAQVQAGLSAMSEISNVFARGAQSDPEREEAKKILEEVNLEELERAVEGIEGEADDEELRGFARDVSGRRGEGTAPPPAVLEVVEGINMGKVFPLSRTSSVTSVGKAPDNTIALPEDKALSRYHAKVIFRSNKFVIMDLDSTNGTGVNGEAITEADLHDEDEIIMGGARYIFRITARP